MTFAEATMVVALGITMSGEKRYLGFVETDTENEPVLTAGLREGMEETLTLHRIGVCGVLGRSPEDEM